jgi:glycerol-3-phosphate cytidylyltransferase
MKTIFTVGVFDLLHVGHILLFKHAKELGDRLVVAVQNDDVILKYKPDAEMVNTTEERLFMVQSIRYVDKVVTYDDVDEIVKNVDFDIFAKGPDQCHERFQRAVKWCQEHGREVVTIPRTEGISSSMLRHLIAVEP